MNVGQHYKLITITYTRVEADDFKRLINAYMIALHRNRIYYIDDEAFSNCSSMGTLYISENWIIVYPQTLGPSLAVVDAGMNIVEYVPHNQFHNYTTIRVFIGSNHRVTTSWAREALRGGESLRTFTIGPCSSTPNLTEWVPLLEYLYAIDCVLVDEDVVGLNALTKVEFAAPTVSIPRFMSPALRTLTIADALTTLPDLSLLTLTTFTVGTDFTCDPALCWVLFETTFQPPNNPLDAALCVRPSELAGIRLKDVYPVHMRCYESELSI